MRIPTRESHLPGQSRTVRKGFTLLEVLLAAAIGVLLMGALYVAMQVQLDHAQAGRDAVEQSLLVRALLRRMSNDIAPSLGPALPNTASGATAGAGGAGGAAGGTGGAGGAGGGAAAPANTSTATTSTTPVLNLR